MTKIATSIADHRTGREPAPVEASAWDAFVGSVEPGSYLQTTPWAAVKAVNGWTSRRLLANGPDGRVGIQVLLRQPRGFPWAFGYAPRGPVLEKWTPASLEALTAGLEGEMRRDRPPIGGVSHVRVDPEVEADGPFDPDGMLRRAFRTSGWRRAVPVQPVSTRLIDLRADEASLWGDLRKKWRQYVNRARSAGVTISDAEGDALSEFYAVYQETARRAGFLIRTEQAYRDIWEAFRPLGMARLLFARGSDGTALATLFLVRCGSRVVEPYGGMTGSGADSRANYLLKWEAIRSSREAGASTYDLWGLAHPGIAHFKAGFGGREVHYVGAWDLVLDPLGRRAFDAAQAARDRIARIRHGLPASTSPGGAAGYAGDA